MAVGQEPLFRNQKSRTDGVIHFLDRNRRACVPTDVPIELRRSPQTALIRHQSSANLLLAVDGKVDEKCLLLGIVGDLGRLVCAIHETLVVVYKVVKILMSWPALSAGKLLVPAVDRSKCIGDPPELDRIAK